MKVCYRLNCALIYAFLLSSDFFLPHNAFSSCLDKKKTATLFCIALLCFMLCLFAVRITGVPTSVCCSIVCVIAFASLSFRIGTRVNTMSWLYRHMPPAGTDRHAICSGWGLFCVGQNQVTRIQGKAPKSMLSGFHLLCICVI